MLDALPYRGDGSDRPAGLALPPGPMPRRVGTRPLKRWRYVGVYGPELMLCAGTVHVAGVPQTFWAVWDREGHRLWERTVLRRGRVALPDGAVRVADREVSVDLVLEPAGDPVEVVSRHGAPTSGRASRRSARRDSSRWRAARWRSTRRGLIDETAGYHARRTAWEWSAGPASPRPASRWCGTSSPACTTRLASASARCGSTARHREVGPVAFAEGLDTVGDLRFSPEAERVRRDDLLLIASDYRQPFGTFAGTLPDGTELASGHGVMERHRARW